MGKKDTTSPNNSQAIEAMSQMNAQSMMHQSDNMYTLGMAQIGQQIMQSQSMFMLGQAQIDSTMQLGRERLQNSLQIAKLNYQEHVEKYQDQHEEKMAELDLRRHEIDVEAASNAQSANQMGTDGFFG